MRKGFNFKSYRETENLTCEFPAKERFGFLNLVMSICAYLGLLIVVPLLFGRKSDYVRFHTKQGLNLIYAGVIVGSILELLKVSILDFSVLSNYIGNLIISIFLIYYLVAVFCGIINVVKGQAETLPYVGKF